MVMRQCFFWPGMWKSVQDYEEACDTYVQVNQRAGNVVSLRNTLSVVQGHQKHVRLDYFTQVRTCVRGIGCIVTFMNQYSRQTQMYELP